MGNKSVIEKQLYAAQSLAASFTSDWIAVKNTPLIGLTLEVTGVTNNDGSFAIQAKNDPSPSATPFNVDLDDPMTLADANNTFLCDLAWKWSYFRLKYTKGSGTQDGALTCWLKAGGYA